MARLRIEPHHAVVEQYACARHGDTAAPEAQQRLGQADSNAVTIDDTQMRRAAAVVIGNRRREIVRNAEGFATAGLDRARAIWPDLARALVQVRYAALSTALYGVSIASGSAK
jgi:hypothetical protein